MKSISPSITKHMVALVQKMDSRFRQELTELVQQIQQMESLIRQELELEIRQELEPVIRQEVRDSVLASFTDAAPKGPTWTHPKTAPKTAQAAARRKKRSAKVMRCRHKGCKNRSRGPRFHYLCPKHE